MLVFEQFGNIFEEDVESQNQHKDELQTVDQKDVNVEDPSSEEDLSISFNSNISPLKKYYLLEKLNSLKNELFKYGIHNDNLNLLIKFQDELSYNSLLNISDLLISSIEKEILDLKKEKTI